MIVDSSAILAILLDESEREQFRDLLTEAPTAPNLSPVNYLEICLRIDRGGMTEASAKLNDLLSAFNISMATVTPEQAILAREAYQRYGKGNHKARLNLGDCFAYALAKARSEPLLFKGDDFRQTDVEAVL